MKKDLENVQRVAVDQGTCVGDVMSSNIMPAGKNFTNPLTTPEGIAKLKAHPKTAGFFSQPDFVAKLEA